MILISCTLLLFPKSSYFSKLNHWGLPWWRSGWESACQCRGHGFEPWSGRIPHAAEQLGLWATTTEPAHLEPVLCNKWGRDSERHVHRDEEWPPLATTRESPRTETKTQHSHKWIKLKKKRTVCSDISQIKKKKKKLNHWSRIRHVGSKTFPKLRKNIQMYIKGCISS